MRKVLSLLFFTLVFHLVYGQESSLFDELQENVWYLPTEDEQTRLYMTSIGKGDTLITLHGGPGNDFNYLVDAVRGNAGNHTFILFDQRGSLLSPVADSLTNQLSLDMLVDDLETIRKTFKQDKITLFGHSFGTLLAISYYIKYPQHVKGIILTAAMPPYITKEKPFSEKLREIHGRVKQARERPAVTEILKKEGLLNDTLLTARQKSDRFRITGLASFNMHDIANWRKFKGGGVYYNRQVDGAIGATIPDAYDIRPSLNRFPVPIIIIQGDKDYIDPSAGYWSTLLNTYPTVKLKVIKDASHYSWLDDKEEFDKELRHAMESMEQRY